MSDAAAAGALLEHLADEGFPSRRLGRDELEVLYPGPPNDLVSAAELDLWRASHPGVTVTIEARRPTQPTERAQATWSRR